MSAYLDALAVIQQKTGGAAGPQTTLRESLENAASLPPVVREAFAELTALAETATYSGLEPGENTAARAERLAATIKQG